MAGAYEQAMDFIENEKPFHLGFLPTEQSHPDSRSLEADFRRDSQSGVRTLQKIDRNVLAMARRVLAGEEFSALCSAMLNAVKASGRIVFSGCGATGRLSILLEAMWRTACRDFHAGAYADNCLSIMTGGDYALVRSVEFFEDYRSFGRRQVGDMGLCAPDILVAITEGGETSSVLGTCEEALARGMKVFLMFNNPAELLSAHLERSRRIICDPRVTVLDLSCGPMAVAGSTRMQATSSEQLIAGAALESAFCRLTGRNEPDYASEFASLLARLEAPEAVAEIANYIDFEAKTYAEHGKITYYTDRFLLDVFTDTTERAPTFMLPPFRRKDNPASPPSWAFVKNPKYSTPGAWANLLCRELRCLEWTSADYRAMGAPENIIAAPPHIGRNDLLGFEIGREPAADRMTDPSDAAVWIAWRTECGDEEMRNAFAAASASCRNVRILALGGGEGDFRIPLDVKESPLRLSCHMAVKLVLNTVSTGTMVKLGRVSGNWMSWVDLSNKKLIDRGTRLVAELGNLDYKSACVRLFEAKQESEARSGIGERESAVQIALRRLKN